MKLKPPRWNVSPALIAPEAQSLWTDVAFVAPLWDVGGGKGALLNSLGRPLAGSNLVAGSTAEKRGTPYGLGAGISGASNLLYQDNFIALPTSNGVGTGDFTVVCLANPPAEAAISNAIGQNVSGVQPRFDMLLNSDGIGISSGRLAILTRDGTNVIADVTGVVDGRYHLFGGSRDGTNVRAWVDGVLRTTTSGTVQNIAGTGGGFAIGSRAEHTVSRINVATTVVFVAGWKRALNAAEHRLLARDPFIMFRPVYEWRGVWTLLGYAISRPVAWRILSRAGKQAAWRIAVRATKDSAWRILTRSVKVSAWRLFARDARAAVWRVFARGSQPSAWRIMGRAAKSTAWRVLARAARQTAWSILNTLQAAKAVAWRIAGRASKPSAWRVLARATRSSAWRIFARDAKASAWRIFNRAAQPSAWRILTRAASAATWRIFSRSGRASAWRILTRVSRGADWRIMGRRAAASAWRIAIRAARAVSWRLGPLPSVGADVHLSAAAHTRNFSVAGHTRHFYATDPRR